MLIGNKSDMIFNRHVTKQEGQDFANQHGLLFAETSAKLEDQNVHEVFSQIAEKIYDDILSGEIQPSDNNGIRQYGFSDHTLPLHTSSDEAPSRWNRSFCCFQ
jgi:Ras-related protein Rab-2A